MTIAGFNTFHWRRIKMNFSVQTINSYFWSYQSLVKITKKVWVTLQTLFICILISISAGHVEAKEINQNAVSYAEDYFNLNLAEDLFGGIKISTALKKTNRSDFKFLGEGQQDAVKQIAYLSLKPDFMMVTVSKIVTSDDILSVNITKLDTDIPFSKIKYLAYDSITGGKGKNKLRTFYMGEGFINGMPIKHLLQETSQYTQGDYKQVTWMYAVNYK